MQKYVNLIAFDRKGVTSVHMGDTISTLEGIQFSGGAFNVSMFGHLL